jgi:site-specific DNA recombinase
MIAAIYGRKSTDQSDTAEDAKSITRQGEGGRAFAAARGWAVDERYVILDDDISGAEFTKRPGYMRLLNALKSKPPFDVLIVMSTDRLGREQFEMGYGLKQLAQAGVKVYSYLDGREIKMESAIDKFMLSAMNFAAEIEREKAAQRVSDALLRKARNGYVCGGRCFGYINVVVNGPDGRRSHVDREIHREQALIVVRIFVMCANGMGVKAIAKALNAERVPSPEPQRGRPSAWAPSSVRAVLYRDAYRGIYVYNATKQSDAWGQQTCQDRPETEVIRTPVPHWRIVSDDIWNAAHRRLDAAGAIYLRNTNGQVWGRPPSELASKYLLSGKLRCACCGASMTVRSGASGKKRFYYYVCASYDTRGRSICSNSLLLPLPGADEEIIGKMTSLLDADVVQGAIDDAVELLRADQVGDGARREGLRREIEVNTAEQARFVEAIAAGGDIAALTAALKAREHRRMILQHELDAVDAQQLSDFDSSASARELRRRVDEWRGLVQRNTPIARQVLDRLLADRIAWTPRRDEGIYEYSGRLQLDRLLSGIVLTEDRRKANVSKLLMSTEGMASPAGFEPAF